MSPSVLAPLAERYGRERESGSDSAAGREDDPARVWVMPLVLRLERGDSATRTELLAAAATASLAVCTDPRAAEDGAWHEPLLSWTSGRIRKVARRARGSHWQAVQQLPGLTVTVGGAEVRALVPMRVSDTPKEVSRLQISGGDAPVAGVSQERSTVPLLLVNPAAAMTLGKTAAQVGHATMLLAALLDDRARQAWAAEGYGCAVRDATEWEWREFLPSDDPVAAWHAHGVVVVRDAGFTEIDPGTVTVLAVWQ